MVNWFVAEKNMHSFGKLHASALHVFPYFEYSNYQSIEIGMSFGVGGAL